MREEGLIFLVLTGAILLLLHLSSVQAAEKGIRCGNRLDFEDEDQEKCLFVPRSSKGQRSLSTFTAKHGKLSLKWQSVTTGTSKLRYNTTIPGDQLKNGGIKMWIYKETPAIGKTMAVRLRNKTNAMFANFSVNLGFKGWRGIWVGYAEFTDMRDMEITKVDFVLKHQDTVYIDWLQFVKRMSRQTRDKIVPPLKFSKMWKDAKEFWQQTYRWSEQKPTNLPLNIDSSKTLSLTHIDSRMRNFYCNEKKTTYDFRGDLLERWNELQKSIDNAYKEYGRLQFKTVSNETVVSGPPLFCRNCEKGTRDFSLVDSTRKISFVMVNILLPLALEFHLKSRGREFSKTIDNVIRRLNSSESLTRIAGRVSNNKSEFLSCLGNQEKPYTRIEVKGALKCVNQIRLQRIFNILDYLEDQGWADGSAIGSLDHEMNRNGAGYMHTLFLLKDSLQKDSKHKNRLLNLINTAKWYNDFGEIYQEPFEYKGTTSDRMATIILFRLMIVLIMPTDTEGGLKARQRDMEALKGWMENALTINTAFGGVIKPDYIGFHHKGFYASAYVPQALHTAALVQYLLEGTEFELSTAAKTNLQEALKTLRLTAVKYSTPSSVGGRFPSYDQEVLIKILPAFAYISVSHPGPLQSTPVKGMTITNVNKNANMFLRLYQRSHKQIKNYLKDGRTKRGKSYMNSLGSLDIMEMVYENAMLKNLTAEVSPEGHWAKNFAALSVHRRKDWAVTVKGFNRFVWDFEGSTQENAYGIFGSHGSMEIANSEKALEAHDVNQGWDWTRIPGATTMSMPLNETKLKKTRNFSPLSNAGGVAFQGAERLSSGAFGMDFRQPNYQFLNNPKTAIKLSFKISVFFYQNILVCLGSDIETTSGQKAQTTLFQDKLLRGNETFAIKVNGVQKDSSAPFHAMTPTFKSERMPYTTLVDTKGNSFYIPRASASSLKVHIQDQISETPSAKPSHAYYGTAWLEHSAKNNKYEYAVFVKTPSYKLTAESAWQFQGNSMNPHNQVYSVLQQDGKAHVVKFGLEPEKRQAKTYPCYVCYVIFKRTGRLPNQGPIKKVTRPCRIIVENYANYIYLGISYTDLDFRYADQSESRKLELASDVDGDELFEMESGENEVRVTLNAFVQKTLPETPKVHGSPPDYAPRVRVESSSPHPPNKGNIIVFANLKNGFSVEVKLKK